VNTTLDGGRATRPLRRDELDECLRRADARAELRGIPRALGSLDAMSTSGDDLLLHGWMVSLEQELDRIDVYVDGEPAEAAERLPRDGLAAFLPFVRHAAGGGFVARVASPDRAVACLDLVGRARGRPVARRRALFKRDSTEPVPPPRLISRVIVHEIPDLFRVGGFACFGEFYEAIRPHLELGPAVRMLDWGCGSGRVTTHFLSLADGPTVVGCDIDGEAIRWCSDELRGGTFLAVRPEPPTPFPDAAFDLVVSYSVLTHLDGRQQARWLAEVARLLRPGGVFVASVHGECAASVVFPGQATRVLESGISDERLDPALDGIAPSGYYRSVFQTGAYTRKSFSGRFDVIDVVRGGAGIFQDLVVARRS
jgi:SAM-dependent methyltransferase